jgi:hypothetical protein
VSTQVGSQVSKYVGTYLSCYVITCLYAAGTSGRLPGRLRVRENSEFPEPGPACLADLLEDEDHLLAV